MTSKPHLAFGLFTGAVLTSYYQMSDPFFTSSIANISAASCAVLFGSLAPDLDAPGSPSSKLLPFIARPIQRRWAHRTLLHSIIGAVTASAIVYYIADFSAVFFPIANNIPFILCTFFLAGYLGHLLADSLTVTGVKLAFPYQRAFAYPSSPHHRVRTGNKKQERYFTIFFILLFLSYLPVLKAGGASRAIHRTFRIHKMAKADYLKAANIETYLQFNGSFRHDRVPVSGKSMILDSKESHFTIYLYNKVLTIGDQAIIIGTEYVCEYTDGPPRISELSTVNQAMDSILALIPDDVLMSGELVSQKEFQASAPIYNANDFPTIRITSNSILFSYASRKEALSLNVRIPEDVRRLQDLIRTFQEDIEAIGSEIEKLTEKRSIEKKLIVRYSLQEQMAALKSRRTSLVKRVENMQRRLDEFGSMTVGFSGKLVLRQIPSMEDDR